MSVAEFRIRSVMCAPLVTTDGKPLGAIQLDTQDITKKFREDDLKLLTIVSHLASVAVEKAQVIAALVVREKAQRDLELGKQVQLGFLPRKAPDVPGYEFFGFYSAAQTIGGDYYDYIHMPGGRVAVVLGDVAGKGVPAAMLMAKLSAEARYCLLSEPRPDRAISLLSDQLVRGGIGDRFVTLAAMVLNPVEHTFTLVNAGHQTPLRYCPKAKTFTLSVAEDVGGLPLGLMEGFEYQMISARLEYGETIAVFTDGVTDAASPDGVLFDLDGVHAVATDPEVALNPRPRVIGERLAAAVRKHANGAPQSDDIALVCFGRVEHPAHAAATATRISPLRRGD
jgi:serine phosphatase RsbU (regulator of sigma subunit)